MTLNEIQIKTANLSEIEDFYKHTLELPVERIDKSSISVLIGQSTLKIIEVSEKSEPIYHLAFNIPANKLQEAINWSTNRVELIRKENEVLIADFEAWNANSVYFFDTDGNLLEFIVRHDLNNAETSEFNSKQILNISEIGIVKNKPDDYGKKLIENFGLKLFDKSQNNELFTTIGDDNGLLIIVKKNRNWFPTEIPAKCNWTKITLTESGTKTTIGTM